MNKCGPNVTKLILRIASIKAIPKGGGIASGIEFFMNEELRHKILNEAEIEAIKFIEAIKSAPDNPYGNDDEEISEILLEEIKKKRNAQMSRNDQGSK